jgi:diguanylate cyclase
MFAFTLPFADVCGLLLASFFGFIIGQVNRARKRRNSDPATELRRAQVIADELETIAAELRKAVQSHQRRVVQFKDRINATAGVDDLSAETEKFMKPTMELTYQIGQAYERIRQQSSLLWSLHESRTDALTGVGNRRTFDDTSDSMFTLHSRYGTPFSMALLDVDHFKAINDEQGHLQGDKILSSLGSLLQEAARDSDVVTRYGGEEFVILMPQTDLQNGTRAAERLRAKVEECLGITVSVGVSTADEFQTVEAMVEASDQSLYQAKQSGRNAVWVFSSGEIIPWHHVVGRGTSSESRAAAVPESEIGATDPVPVASE